MQPASADAQQPVMGERVAPSPTSLEAGITRFVETDFAHPASRQSRTGEPAATEGKPAGLEGAVGRCKRQRRLPAPPGLGNRECATSVMARAIAHRACRKGEPASAAAI